MSPEPGRIAEDFAAPGRAAPLTLAQWFDAYRAGGSPAGLLAAVMRRARSPSLIAAWIHLASDAEIAAQLEALEARCADAPDAVARLARLPLYGVPFAVKDNIDVAGVVTTAACPAFAYKAERSASCVRRLQAAGAIWIGKTNLDQFATGLVGTRSPFGAPASVFSASHISGGSSSGSAVAVASGVVPFALGTDTAGSGRVPAAFNQIVGLKPTPGRVGTGGVVPACRTLDCVSIFALTVEDAAHVLSVIEGTDEADAYSRFEPGPARFAGRGAAPGQLRIGIPAGLRLPVEQEYDALFRAAVAQLAALGHAVEEIDFQPMHDVAKLLYAGPWVAERHSVVKALMASRPEAMDPTVREVIGAAGRLSATDAFEGQYALKQSEAALKSTWEEFDLLMVPSVPMHPSFARVEADPIGANSALGTYTNFVNLLGWSALALPAALTKDGLPFGVTFIAGPRCDAALARFGATWQSAVALAPGAPGLCDSGHWPSEASSQARALLRLPVALPTLPIAVVGAHLSGMPLNGQLTERNARLLEKTSTSARYRLHALPGTVPPKPGLVRADADGHAIALEVWEMPVAAVGSFLGLIPPPLGLGSVELADGRWVHGFLCESHALRDAEDVSRFGGWRSYMQSVAARAAAGSPSTPSP